MNSVSFSSLVGKYDILFIVLDTLRYDVAITALERGLTPTIAHYLPQQQWEKCSSPATFTYPAHHAFFAGFLPTPIDSGLNSVSYSRLFAAEFIGSESCADTTWQFKEATIIEALAKQDYHTSCIGGVGFFNKQNAIGSFFPDQFTESHWHPSTGVTCKNSTENQVKLALSSLQALDPQQRLFSFINISALHQPNYFYSQSATQNKNKNKNKKDIEDTIESQIAALAYVDSHLGRLFTAMKQRSPTFCILCSDHGTCYGEEGYYGHKLAHEVVLTVPYAHFFL